MAEDTTGTRRGSRWGNLLLLLVSLLVAGLLAEGVLRLTVADQVVMFPRFHDSADYGPFVLRRMRPGTAFTHTSVDGSWDFTINAQGFRDTADWTRAKPEGTFRVLVLGDSHTQGYEVAQDETYARVIERLLARRGLEAEVLNTGVSGFSTAEALAFLESEGLAYAPDAVVLGFFRNDFEDNLKAGLYALSEEGRLETVKTRHVPGVWVLDIVHAVPGMAWLSQHSYLYSIGFNTAWRLAKEALLSRRKAEMRTEYAVSTKEEVEDRTTALALAILERMHAVTREAGIPLVLLEIPSKRGADGFGPSIPEDSLAAFRARSDALIRAGTVLGPYRGLARFHRPNGHHHINPLAHLLLGKAAGEAVLERAAPPR